MSKEIYLVLAKFTGNHKIASSGILIYTIYIFLQRWIDLYPKLRYFEVVIIISVLFLLFISLYTREKFFNSITTIDLLWFPAIMVILVNLYLFGYNRFDFFIYSSGFLFLLFAKVKLEDYRFSFMFIRYGSLFYALGTIAQFIFTDNFIRFILLFTDKYSYENIVGIVNSNYYPGFGINRTVLAPNFMAVGIGIVLTEMHQTYRRLNAKVGLLLLFFLFAGLLISGKRLLLLATILALPVSYILAGSAKERSKRLTYAAVVILAGVASILTLLQFGDSLPFMIRIEGLINDLIAREATGSVGERFRLYGLAWNLFLENPIFGIGWEQFRIVTANVNPNGYQVHNLYLQLLCETGVIGFTLIMLPIVYSYLKTVKEISLITDKSKSTLIQWKSALVFSFYCQTIFLLNSFGSDPFYDIILFYFYLLVVSIINSFIYYGRNKGILPEEQS